MTIQLIKLGTVASDATYDSTREIGRKANENFAELYALVNANSGDTTPTGTAAPTTGAHVQGEYVRNSVPVEDGSVNSKFIITGWTCLVSGTPGTWVQNRVFTGN